ncbi:thymidylate kinase [Candidatus Uhrbacteria bacterium]|jgi:dTMP kinase|nr:thymidylate kinase [Candidatus Uhrbacteria bacterium]
MDTSITTGAFFVIDGTDGAGKATQTRKLVERFVSEGRAVETISFPQYGAKSAGMVEEYLGGKYGENAKDVNAKAASIFYAVDRFDASFKIKQWVAEGKIVISDRFVGSNMGHQGGKITDQDERSAYLAWNDDMEHNILRIPRPTLNVILSVPVEVAMKLAKQGEKEKTKVKGDIHEKDPDHLQASIETFKEVATNFPGYHLIDCSQEGGLRTIEDIHEEIWRAVQLHVPTPLILNNKHQQATV